MKNILLTCFILLTFSSVAQIREPADWKVSLSDNEAKEGNEVEVIFEVNIDEDWYLYSSDFDPDLGPMVTEFTFDENDTYELIGIVGPINPSKSYDSLWEGEYTYFKKKAKFVQKVKVLKSKFSISGNYSYQVCSDVSGLCIPFDENPFILESSNREKGTSEPDQKPESPLDFLEEKGSTDPYALWSFMLVAFLAGLAALLTPCVFPMIPMTVTYFTGRDHNKRGRFFNSLFYGFCIIFIYCLIGAVLTPFMGPETANDLATGWIPNVIFFIVFVVFALSFFGLFEITLPHKWVNGADKLGDKGGLIGIFFMALTLVLVSFSCTGPLVGSILVESAGGLSLKPVLGMFAFSAAFAIPFSLFAFFPNWLNALPKSGGWLNAVKVVLGFLELALAFKFLSIADQAYHWGILDREIYLAIWIVIFSMMGLYLIGKIKLKSDSESDKITVSRLILGICTFTFVVYLIPGMFGAPLKALAGYLPPLSTHDFNILSNQGLALEENSYTDLCEEPLYDDFLHWPHGLNGYFDYNQALACARQVDKPIFIDFTGHGCVNCREMEAKVWSDIEVLKRLNKDFVLVALYVDDKTELPVDKWYESPYDLKIKKTIGKQNADFQIRTYENNAQPFYVIINPSGEVLLKPQAYDLNVDNFVSFLDRGKQAYKLKQE